MLDGSRGAGRKGSVFERWRGTLFWVLLVFGVASLAWTGMRVAQELAAPGGSTPAWLFDLIIRVGSAASVLWLAWFVFRRPGNA
jgi:hypothetical protein